MSRSHRRRRSTWIAAGLLWLAVLGCNEAGPQEPVVTTDPGAPLFTTTPTAEADHNRPWSYRIGVRDPDGDPVRVSVGLKPAWVAFDSVALTLEGTAGWDQIRTHSFRLSATDGTHTTVQSFNLAVVRGEIVCASEFGDPKASAYVLPFRPGRSQRLIQGYCPTNPAWGHHNWFAYDFDTANGDTLVASRAGRVRAVRSDRPNVGGVCGQGAENFVFIEHGDGTVMSYVHLFTDAVFVSVGEQVEQGQPIGLSGNSGCSSGPHVHVALFRTATNFDRQSTVPFNYSNAEGPLDERNGLVQSARYGALPPGS